MTAARIVRSYVSSVVFALFALVVMLLLGFAAQAQEATPTVAEATTAAAIADPCNVTTPGEDVTSLSALGAFTGDALGGAAAGGAIAFALILASVLWARRLNPDVFAPEVSTATSKLRNLQLALVVGQVLAFLTIAPGIPLPGHRAAFEWSLALLWWLVSKSIGGFGVSTAAVFGRDWYTRRAGMFEERAEAKRSTDTEIKPVQPLDGPRS